LLDGDEVEPSRALTTALRYHRHYRAGHLPARGGVADQNPYLMLCIEIVDTAMREHEAAQLEEQRRKIDTAQGGKGGQRGQPLGHFDGPLPGRRGNRPNWRAHMKAQRPRRKRR
jgi:hypothetical protein